MRTRRSCFDGDGPPRKRRRLAVDFFDALPDDLVVSILAGVAAAADSPADLASALMACRRFGVLGVHPVVLGTASPAAMSVPAAGWGEAAHRFLRRCVDAGNLDAAYMLGMIRFYCLDNRGGGAALMATAAMRGHAPALYSLAVIQFNGSGGSKGDRDLRAGAALCARAAALGHVDALRELGHCLQDGYGVRRNVADGRRLLILANARELAGDGKTRGDRHGACLLSDFGCRAARGEWHPANRFLVEWFERSSPETETEKDGGDRRMCSYGRCGRKETRRHEYRRCSVCGGVNYCSRACQAMHWKVCHKVECKPLERWDEVDGGGEVLAGDGEAAAG